jgi:hypothetical protein
LLQNTHALQMSVFLHMLQQSAGLLPAALNPASNGHCARASAVSQTRHTITTNDTQWLLAVSHLLQMTSELLCSHGAYTPVLVNPMQVGVNT